jgi:hypothetical protein
MHWNDDRPLSLTKLDGAPAPAYLNEPSSLERGNDLSPRDDRERRTHADSWTVAMIGGSMGTAQLLIDSAGLGSQPPPLRNGAPTVPPRTVGTGLHWES